MLKKFFGGQKIVLLLFPFLFFTVANIGLVAASAQLLGQPLFRLKLQEDAGRLYAAFSTMPPLASPVAQDFKFTDARALVAKQFLATHKSLLAPHADFVVRMADEYGVDWRLPIAIAGQESTFCRSIPEDSYNCWGYGIHSRGTKRFGSFEEGIERVTRYLKTDYIDRGLTTPEEMMARYAPLSLQKGGAWAQGVNFFLEELEDF